MNSVEIPTSSSPHILVLDRQGRIVSSNGAWLEFVRQHNASHGQAETRADYIVTLCTFGILTSAGEINRARTGIEEVLQGSAEEFEQEYIFRDRNRTSALRMQCTALHAGEARAVISHIPLDHVQQEDVRTSEESFGEHTTAQKKLMRQEAAGKFTAGIAHDFNNVLAAIIGYSELALFSLPPESRAVDHVNGVLKAGRRARDLIRQLLLFSRENGNEQEPFSLTAVISETLHLFRASLPDNIAISEDLGHTPAIFQGNKRQIQQMLMHLCNSLAKTMTGQDGIIALNLHRMDDSKQPLICRQKSGYADSVLELSIAKKIFRVAAKDDQSSLNERSSPQNTETEPGLAAAEDIALSHRGRIVISREFEQIDRITVYLPAYKEIQSGEKKEGMEVPRHGKGHILIVDDEASLISVTSENLKSLGYSVTSRLCGKEALELFRNTPEQFDLVISDLTMPEITGDKLAARLIEVRPDIPIIIYTGYSTPELKNQVSRLGVRAVLEKPSSRGELAKLVQNVLAEKHPLNFSSEGEILQ